MLNHMVQELQVKVARYAKKVAQAQLIQAVKQVVTYGVGLGGGLSRGKGKARRGDTGLKR